ncbi:hypothetical protein D3C80_1762650 [compost metagenome]
MPKNPAINPPIWASQAIPDKSAPPVEYNPVKILIRNHIPTKVSTGFNVSVRPIGKTGPANSDRRPAPTRRKP